MTYTHPFYTGQTGEWEAVIGLEVHAQITAATKLFSGAATEFAADPNTEVSFIDAAFPGMLPVVNRYCIEQAIKTGLGINAQIHKVSIFDRKNYFYADLPQGYQISQFYHPIVGEGYIDIDLSETTSKRVGIERLHLEQDAGKSFHDHHPTKSYIDLNRCGIALMEIVSKPELHSPDEAMAYMRKLRTILRYLGTNDGNMDEGSLRADVNVSVRKPGDKLGTRAEIKNINSIRFIGQAIVHEISRQIDLIETGHTIVQETRLFDPSTGTTRTMRSKEDAQDYRYFPDPDLLPIVVEDAFIAALKDSLPELPDAKKARLIATYGLTAYEASVLVMEASTAGFYEAGVTHLTCQDKGPKLLATWLMGDFFAGLNHNSLTLAQAPVTEVRLAELVNLITDGTISGRIAKDVFEEMWATQQSPAGIVADKGLVQIADPSALMPVIDEILASHPDKVAEYRSGKDKLFGFFVGQAMKATQGKGNPALINDLLHQKLSATI